jgi:hypothetical protein
MALQAVAEKQARQTTQPFNIRLSFQHNILIYFDKVSFKP